MPQLHFYISDGVAARAKLPISRYVAELVKRDVGQVWPEGYFERISGAAEGASITHEPAGPPEERLPLE